MHRFRNLYAALTAGAAILALTACSGEERASAAQPQPQPARSELEISAGLAPQLDEAILRNMVEFCVEHAPGSRLAVEASWKQWQERNAAHLTVARYYRDRLETAAATGASEDERRANQELLTQHATLIESFTNQQLDLMHVALEHDEPKVVAQLCVEHFAKVSAGEWDVRQRDPEIAALLDAGIPKPPAEPAPQK